MYHYLMVIALILGGVLLMSGILLEERKSSRWIGLICNILGMFLMMTSVLTWLAIHFELVTIERI